MIEQVLKKLQETPEKWREDAARRRGVSAVDPVADAFAFCAGELEAKLAELNSDTYWLTPAQYAEAFGIKSEQTIRNWIERGELEAENTPTGWRIARTAERRRRA